MFKYIKKGKMTSQMFFNYLSHTKPESELVIKRYCLLLNGHFYIQIGFIIIHFSIHLISLIENPKNYFLCKMV